MSLLDEISSTLDAAGIRHALIGALAWLPTESTGQPSTSTCSPPMPSA